jgi:hypothetical protein
LASAAACSTLLAEACAEAAACWALVEALSARVAAASAWLAALVARSAGSGPEEQPPTSERAKAAPPTSPSSFDVFPINPSILFLLEGSLYQKPYKPIQLPPQNL